MRVIPEHGEPWVGNFQPGGGSVFKHPNGNVLVVVAGWQVYVVDANSRRLLWAFPESPRCLAWVYNPETLATDDALILATGTQIIVIGSDEPWVSPEVALWGIANLRLDGSRLTAKGWFDPDEPPWNIEIDIAARQVLASAL